MTRSSASAKAAGSKFERLIADHLASKLEDDRIDRRVRGGAADKGDIGGVRAHGQKVTLELKDYGGRFEVGTWLREAETERVHDGAVAAVVVAKRRGSTNPAEQVVFCTVADLVALLTGRRSD